MSAQSDEAPGAPAHDLWVGYGAAAVAVFIWAGWIVATRESVGADYGVDLAPADIALLRFGVPALVFAPFWLRGGLKPKHLSWGVLLALLGWGAPFALLAAQGMRTATVAEVGALVPGMMPLWAAALGWVAFREQVGGARRLGLALIAGAAVAMLVQATLTGDAGLTGAPWLVGAAICWAVFAIAFKRSGLGPVHAAGLVSVYSVVMVTPFLALYGTALTQLTWNALMAQIVVQGVLSGAVSIACYTVAIDRLGPQRAASLSALVPVLAAVMGVAWLGEGLSALDWVAIVAASLGVALVNGAFSARQTPNP